jgi:tyrosyl-tRNA synthetase
MIQCYYCFGSRVVNNLKWYRELDLVRFIADIGRHLRVGTMLSRHSVQTRMASETGINFTEFSYQLFQAYDWLHLLKNHDCKFQVYYWVCLFIGRDHFN